MKFSNVAAFEKHLREAAPSHLSKAYLVTCASDYERKKIVQRIVASFSQDASAQFYEGGKVEVGSVLESLNTRPLFSSFHLVVLENVQALAKSEMEALSGYVASPSPFACLIVSGSASKSLADLYTKGKKEMVVVDLSEEKPWDRDKRLKEWLGGRALQEGRTLAPDALHALFAHIGPDLAALEQELAKLICFIGERKRIECVDVQALCLPNQLKTGWQSAEALIWEGRKEDIVIDVPTLLALIGQMRHHLYIGERMTYLLSQNLLPQEINDHFRELKGKAFERYFPIAKQRGANYFRRGLLALFELETAAKSTSSPPELLFDLFALKLKNL